MPKQVHDWLPEKQLQLRLLAVLPAVAGVLAAADVLAAAGVLAAIEWLSGRYELLKGLQHHTCWYF